MYRVILFRESTRLVGWLAILLAGWLAILLEYFLTVMAAVGIPKNRPMGNPSVEMNSTKIQWLHLLESSGEYNAEFPMLGKYLFHLDHLTMDTA